MGVAVCPQDREKLGLLWVTAEVCLQYVCVRQNQRELKKERVWADREREREKEKERAREKEREQKRG